MTELRNVLTDVVGGGTLLTVQPGSTHGDSLTRQGFEEYLDGTAIRRIDLDDSRFDESRGSFTGLTQSAKWGYQQLQYARTRLFEDVSAVYIHGSGNVTDRRRAGIDCFLTVARFFDCPIIVGPQSCQFEETDPSALFERVDNETHFFCREKYSYDVIWRASAQCDHVEVYADDDTALYVEERALPKHSNTAEYTLLALRTDGNSLVPTIGTDITAPLTVNDISTMEQSYGQWVRAAARAERIYTDRVRVAILGWILDTPVTWYDTEQHTGRGVYEYSLSDEPQITFRHPTDHPHAVRDAERAGR
ncbi:hypothetical protein GRX03_15415 [Halovenus sp. WSH3]|uniref:Uncharacterized protein n=1 Tax=Halovenus carboxidivorans TaxID=2692199 RepID=A0A6B0T7R9_9EURY|nr:polysaccharide pyruvyl transferase family protein [Halovenus carboxidivorans]MXR52987.1 hypothetical protein [Halovenus carboxidivorans]